MLNEESYLLVHGDFYAHGVTALFFVNYQVACYMGTIELKGDLIQRDTPKTNDGYTTNYSFSLGDDVRLVLSGAKAQNLSFESRYYIPHLYALNKELTTSTGFCVSNLMSSLTLNGDVDHLSIRNWNGMNVNILGSNAKPSVYDVPSHYSRIEIPHGGLLDTYFSPNGVSPQIVTQPANQTVLTRKQAAFTVSATGSEILEYQWQVSTDGGQTYNDVADGQGGNATTYVLPPATITMDGNQYRCVVKNSLGTVTSEAASLTVHNAFYTVSLGITLDGAAYTGLKVELDEDNMTSEPLYKLSETEPGVYTSTAVPDGNFGIFVNDTFIGKGFSHESGGNGTLEYYTASFVIGEGMTVPDDQILLDGALITEPAVQLPSNKELEGWFTDAAFTTEWEFATDTVENTTVLYAKWTTIDSIPMIMAQPMDQIVAKPNNAIFSVVATGGRALNYQWYVKQNDVVDWSALTGETNASLEVSPTAFHQTGYRYRVTVSNAIGTVTSNAVMLTVTGSKSYRIISGNNVAWKPSSNEPLMFRADGDFSEFDYVAMDGFIVDAIYYDAWSGSTFVSLHEDYLSALQPGSHVLMVCFTDGYALARFFIQGSAVAMGAGDSEIPDTGDSAPVLLLTGTILASLASLAICHTRRRRKRRSETK